MRWLSDGAPIDPQSSSLDTYLLVIKRGWEIPIKMEVCFMENHRNIIGQSTTKWNGYEWMFLGKCWKIHYIWKIIGKLLELNGDFPASHV